MNEKLQYATMLEIPVNTCSITVKQSKKRRFFKRKEKNAEQVKEQLVRKVNEENGMLDSDGALTPQAQDGELAIEQAEQASEAVAYETEQQDGYLLDSQENESENYSQENTVNITQARKTKKPFKFSVIGVQFAIIGALVATIFLTNALYVDSGINVFFRNVFRTENTITVDDRTHADFAPVIALGKNASVSVDQGVMTFSGTGSVYAGCDGKVSALTVDENGKYTMEITHSDNFKSVIGGMDFVYASLSDMVYSNIPVGYTKADGATMCFKGVDDLIISDYQIIDGSVVWVV